MTKHFSLTVLIVLGLASPVAAQSPIAYWLYVGGAWKGSYKQLADCQAAGKDAEGAECRPMQLGPSTGSGGKANKWSEDVAYCGSVSGVDAYVSAPGEAQFLGKTANRFDFSRCMIERGHTVTPTTPK